MPEPTCDQCGSPIDPGSRYTWVQGEGFGRPGKAGGRDVILWKATGPAMLHDRCANERKEGIPPRQLQLQEGTE